MTNSRKVAREVQTPPQEVDYSRFSPLEVKIESNYGGREDFEQAFRKFKMLFQREGIVGTLKERSHFEKPSDKKRRKQREAQERNSIAQMRDRQVKSGEWDKIQKQRMQKKLTKEEKKAKEVLNGIIS